MSIINTVKILLKRAEQYRSENPDRKGGYVVIRFLPNPPANDDHIPDAGNMVIAEHPRCGKPYYLAECRTTSGRLVMAEGRTPGECKAALFNALNYHTATLVA